MSSVNKFIQTMKKLTVIAFAFAALVGCKQAPKAEGGIDGTNLDQIVNGGVAYVQVDAVLAQSDMSQSEGKALREKTEKTQDSWAKKERNLQNEIGALNEKYQKGLITTRDAQEQQEKLQARAVSYQNAAQKEAKELEEENAVFQNRMLDLLQRTIQEINSDRKYTMIINASALLDADTTLDISAKVLEKFNELYKAEKK